MVMPVMPVVTVMPMMAVMTMVAMMSMMPVVTMVAMMSFRYSRTLQHRFLVMMMVVRLRDVHRLVVVMVMMMMLLLGFVVMMVDRYHLRVFVVVMELRDVYVEVGTEIQKSD